MKILLIQLGAIGDILMCTPAIRALRIKYPDAKITFLVSKKNQDALKYNPNINKLLIIDLKVSFFKYFIMLIKFIFTNYDIVIDFQRSPRTAIITFLIHAPKKISFRGKHRNYAYNLKVGYSELNKYAALNKLKLLKPLGIIEEKFFLPEIFITEKEKEYAEKLWEKLGFSKNDFVVAVSPVSIKEYRRWDLKKFAKACDLLSDKFNAKFVFTWGPEEKIFVEKVINMMEYKPDIDYEISSILELKAIFEKSSLFLGNDNGPRHIAISADIPTIGIFSHLYSSHWTPPGLKKHISISPRNSGINNVELEDLIKVVLSRFEWVKKNLDK